MSPELTLLTVAWTKLDLTSLNYINWRVINKREIRVVDTIVVLARLAVWDYLVLVVVALPRRCSRSSEASFSPASTLSPGTDEDRYLTRFFSAAIDINAAPCSEMEQISTMYKITADALTKSLSK